MLRDHPHATIPVMHKYLISAVVIAAIAPAPGAAAATPAAHWCRQGDPSLYASADTVCELAGNMITDYVNVCHERRNCRMRVDSPTSRMRYRITCNRRGGRYTGTVYCQGPGDTGIWTRFSALI
jgi:phosphate-selective porin